MIYAYIRVSTERQTVENQKLLIRSYCKTRRLGKISWVAETISGTKKIEKRMLGSLIKNAEPYDTIVVTELSRLGRSLRMILDILEDLLSRNVKVISIKEGFELGDNIQSKVLAFAFGLCAELERTLLSERTKQGLFRARAEGKRIGRKSGWHPKKYKLSSCSTYILNELKNGRTKTSIAKELGVSRTTLNSFIRLIRVQN